MRILLSTLIITFVTSAAHAEILLNCNDSFGIDKPGTKNFSIANDGSWASDGIGEKITRNKKAEEEVHKGKGWVYLKESKDFVGNTHRKQIIFNSKTFELTYWLQEVGKKERDHLRYYNCTPHINPFIPN